MLGALTNIRSSEISSIAHASLIGDLLFVALSIPFPQESST